MNHCESFGEEMSKMRSSYLKPPLPKSPIRLRSRQVIISNSSSTLQTPPELESKLPIEYSSISTAEEEDVKVRAAASKLEHLGANSVPVLERGRFYEEYSAKRNERLKRKKGGEESVGGILVKGTPYNLGVNHEPMTTKRRGASKKKTAETMPRYSLRSITKENYKPPLPLNVACSAIKTVTTKRI